MLVLASKRLTLEKLAALQKIVDRVIHMIVHIVVRPVRLM